jgi:hypothetical protein
MRHYHRTHIAPADVIRLADEFFPRLELNANVTGARARTFSGPLGTMTLTARPEGGHYTFIEVVTDQIGESRLDKNVKKFFVEVHRQADPAHLPTAGY